MGGSAGPCPQSPEDQFHYYGGIRRKYVGDPAQLKVFLDSVTSGVPAAGVVGWWQCCCSADLPLGLLSFVDKRGFSK